MEHFKRIFLVVLDSVGIGEAPDAHLYHDQGANTLGHIAEHMNGLSMPHMSELGLSNIEKIKGINKVSNPKAHITKMQEASIGKDTMTGHWEIMGLKTENPFQTFPTGFPADLLSDLTRLTGRGILGNKPASGTEIIKDLGKKHMETGSLIVYTSADSVLQIAAHEEIIPIQEQYEICKVARQLTMNDRYRVGRVISRPFIGQPGNFNRTVNRRDYALKPFKRTVMNELKDANYDVISLGKIVDIFDGEGITTSIRTENNDDGMTKLIQSINSDFNGLCFLNLVDFDAKYGHRRDPLGYGRALEAFDKKLPEVLSKLREEDLIIFTADHGNDPVHHGTDHTREYVPLLVYHQQIEVGRHLPVRKTFADIGATISDNFHVPLPALGTSFFNEIRKDR